MRGESGSTERGPKRRRVKAPPRASPATPCADSVSVAQFLAVQKEHDALANTLAELRAALEPPPPPKMRFFWSGPPPSAEPVATPLAAAGAAD